MDFNLEDDDDMIVIVIGDNNEGEHNSIENNTKKQTHEGPEKDVPFPITIKVEPLEEDEVVSLNVENLIRTAAEHGHLIKIKEEQPDDGYEVPVISNPKTTKNKRPQRKVTKKKTNAKKSKTKNPITKKTITKKQISKKRKAKIIPDVDSSIHVRRATYYGYRSPPVSFVAELRKKYPELKKDKEKLISYLANTMRTTVPPDPPQDYYIIDVDGNFSCSICDAKTYTMAAAARHYQNKHGPRYLKCFACGLDFWSTVNLYKHEKRCSAPDAKIVLQARGQYLGRKGRGRPFLSDNKFKPRMHPLDPKTGKEKTPAVKKKFACSFCSAVFVHKETWESHENIHNGLRPFKCALCPSAYPSKMGLKKHKMTHSNQVFTCDHCNRSFKLKVTLIAHMDTHLPHRKFGCDLCPKRYSQRTALVVHINRDHLNLPPPCACPQCPKRYARMSHLKIHMLREHGLKLMTRKMFYKHLPRMNLQEMKDAQVVFNEPVIYKSADGEEAEWADADGAEYCGEAADYLEVPEEDAPDPRDDSDNKRLAVITQKTPVFHIRLSSS